MTKMRMNQAINAALQDEMDHDPSVILLGEDIAAAGGPFKTSEGLLERFGANRVLDTPISEMGFLGAAVGAAVTGLKPVVEMMFVDFLGVALDQLVTEAAKFRYLSRGVFHVPLVVRASAGAGGGFGCQHSQTLEPWFNTPGVTLCVASGARSAYGLLRSAIRNPDPVVVLEPRSLYGSRENVDQGIGGLIPLGTASIRRAGNDVTVVTTGQMVAVALDAAEELRCSAEIIDLQTLVPWDQETVESSLRRTGRLAILEEGSLTGGWGSWIAAHAAGIWHSLLQVPVLRVGAPDVPVPFSRSLESAYVPSAHYVRAQLEFLVDQGRLPDPWWKELTR